MQRFLRRLIAGGLAASLVFLSPGLECYQALGGQFAQKQSSRGTPGGRLAPLLSAVDIQTGIANGASQGVMAPLRPLPAATEPAAGGALKIPRWAGGSAVAVSPAAPSPVKSQEAPSGKALAEPAVLEEFASVAAAAIADLSRPGAGSEAVHQIGRRLEGTASRDSGAGEVAGQPQEPSSPNLSLRSSSLEARNAAGASELLSPRAPERGQQLAPRRGWGPRAVRGLGKALKNSIGAMRRLALAAGLTVAMTLAIGAAAPRNTQAQEANKAPNAAQAVPMARQAAESGISVSVSIDRQGVTVGERVRFTFTLKNESDKQVTILSLRSALEEALPEDLEIQGGGGNDPIVLKPGESKSIVFEVIPFNSGELKVGGPLILTVDGPEGPAEMQLSLPETTFQVKTVLTPDWKEIGFKDIADIRRKELPQWAWLAAIPLLLILLIGVERLLAAKRAHPKAPSSRLPLLVQTEDRIAALEKPEGAALGPREFYAEFFDVLSTFLVDYHGLPTRQRDSRGLAADLKASGKLGSGQLKVASDLAERAESARFGGEKDGVENRRRDLKLLRALVENVAGSGAQAQPAPKAGSSSAWGLMGFLPAAAVLQFANPWALLLFIPFAGYLVWSFLKRKSAPSFTVSSSAILPARKSLRQRLSWLPRALHMGAVGLILFALAGPRLGVTRRETYVPSTDTMMAIDLSGSMGGKKLEDTQEAVKAYVNEQRRGTSNRVGMVTFSDHPYVDVRLTTDYDALIAHLKELKASGSTAVGKAMLASIAHFIELNAFELDDSQDPRIPALQKIIKDQGLGAALEYAKPYPDLMEKLIRPDRKKIAVLFTDGESNKDIPPLEAASIAKKLGIRFYTVGIGEKDGAGFDEKTLKAVAEITGGQYFRADDAGRMREVLLEISRLEKSPAKIVSSISVNDYGHYLLILALISLSLGVFLSNTRLRTLQGILILTLPLSGPQWAPSRSPGPSALVQTAGQAQEAAGEALPLKGLPPEMSAGNLLYNEGRFAEALKKYAEALERYPDVPELYFNMGNAYLRLGDTEQAAQSYQKFLSLNKDPVLASKAYYNMGNAALMQKDAEQALEMYKEALRRDPNNAEAKWNLEVLKKLMQEQQGKGGKNQKQKPGKQNGKQQGKPGDQEGKGDQRGQSDADKGKSGADQLAERLAEQEKADAEAARKAITRKGNGTWGLLGLPLALGGAGSTALVFSSPLLAWGLVILAPILVGLIAYGIHKRLQAARELTPGTAPKGFRSWWGRKRFLTKAGLLAAGVILCGLAAAGPRSGTRDERLNFGGKDVVVTVDASHSMVFAEDERLERTKKELIAFISRLQGTDRVGLVVFAGTPRTASPISIDYGNFEYKTNRLEYEARGLKEGSNLAEAVKHAAESFETVKKIGDRKRLLILISDGDIFGQDLEEAIKTAREHGIVINTIGMGTPQGTKMKVPTVDGKGTEYIIDSKTGQPALTRLNEEPLRRIAQGTGGEYFEADKDAIDRIISRMAELQKGEKSDTVRSPRSVAFWFLWPALLLLLLDLLLPSKSALKPGAPQKPEAPKEKTTPMAGGLLLGAAMLPLNSWALIFPFALLAAIAGVLLLADLWSAGALSRRARWAWERRRGLVEKGLASDLGGLFDLREKDLESLTQFVGAWSRSPETGKKDLIREASQDVQLWRQKLAAAYLYGNSPEVQEGLLSAMTAASRAYLEPMEPVLLALLSRRAQLPWLDHVDAARRLSRLSRIWLDPSQPGSRSELESLSGYPDREVSQEAKAALAAGAPEGAAQAPKKAPRSLLARGSLGVLAALLSGILAFTGFAGWKTAEYLSESSQAEESSLRIFYGDDMFIFSDRYVDERIPEEVLPALRNWQRGPARAHELDRAIEILSESPDPKADNVLEAVFKRADLLSLSKQAEKKLLTTLVLRENDQIWRFMVDHMARSAGNPRAVALMKRMITIGLKEGTEKTFQNLFYFLKSPNPDLRGHAAQAIYGSLASDERKGRFFERLTAAQGKFASDPELNLWTEIFLLQRLATAPSEELDAAKARELLGRILDAGEPFNSQRAQAFAAAKPGEEDQMPTSYLEAIFGLMEQVLENSRDAAGAVPASLAEMEKFAINHATTGLILEGEKLFGDLHEKLQKAGVVLEDGPPIPHWEEQEHSFGSGEPVHNYREIYKLPHLRDLRRILSEERASGGMTPEIREYLQRADKTLGKMIALGPKAGMLEGGSVGEKASEDVNKLLSRGYESFSSESRFMKVLRSAGLAPDNGATGEDKWRETYSFEDMQKLKAFLKGLAASGRGWDDNGSSRALSWDERLYLVEALERIDELAHQYYPEKAPAPDKPADEPAFWRSLETPGEESLALARLALGSQKRSSDGEFQFRVLQYLEERLSGPQGKKAAPEEADAVLEQIFKFAQELGKTDLFLSELNRALEGGNPDGPLAAAARQEIQRLAVALIEEAVPAFEGFNDRLTELKVRPSAWSHRSYKLVHLRTLLQEIEKAAAKEKEVSEGQRETLSRARSLLPRLIEAGTKAGLPGGDTPAETVAEPVNEILKDGFTLFPGSTFHQALQKAGLAPRGGSPGDLETGYFQKYSREDLVKIRRSLQDLLDGGQGWEFNGTRRPLTDREREYLRKAIEGLGRHIDNYPKSVKLHGFAPVALAFLGSGALIWIAALAAAAIVVFAVYLGIRRLWRKAKAGEVPPPAPAAGGAVSGEVLERYKRLELFSRRIADSVTGGSFRSALIGAGGSEFAESRPYQDEDVRDIDWKASARQGGLYAKKYELEKEMPLLLLVDISRSSQFGTRGSDKKTVIEDVSAVLAMAAAHQGLRVGAVLFTDRVEAYIQPRSGMDHVREIIRRITTLDPKGRDTDLKPALELALKKAQSREMVAVVSDFLAPGFKNLLAAVSQRHDLKLLRVLDPAEERVLPDVGMISVRDAETGELREVDTHDAAFRAQHAALLARREAELSEAFSQARARPIVLSTAEDYLERLSENFQAKKKTPQGARP